MKFFITRHGQTEWNAHCEVIIPYDEKIYKTVSENGIYFEDTKAIENTKVLRSRLLEIKNWR